MKCVKMPVDVYYIACLVHCRQKDKGFNFIYSRKGKSVSGSLLKKSQPQGGSIMRMDMHYMKWKYCVYCVEFGLFYVLSDW